MARLVDLVEEWGLVYPDGVSSPPVWVTWTGGPDLTIDLFIPPVLKSEGGNPLYISEVTANHGIINAAPSVTRYYLSDSPAFQPETQITIGERNVPNLAPDESSEVRQVDVYNA